MDLLKVIRNHPRFPILWPTLYGGDDFIGQGTVLDVSLMGCRLAGTMPPDLGMRLSLCLYPAHRSTEVYIEEARVKWIKDEQFGIEFVKVRTKDLQWLIGYLDRAERRNSFKPMVDMDRTTEGSDSMPLALPLGDS
jgi:PilZ domain-containing protein